MFHSLVIIKVADYAQWRASFDSVDDLRHSYGQTGYQVLQSAQDSNEVLVLLAWEDEGRALEYLNSPQLREAMQEGGVQGCPPGMASTM